MSRSGSYCYEYPRPEVTTDVVVFSVIRGLLHVLLIERDNAPFEGRWALPGHMKRPKEDLDASARSALAKAGVGEPYLEQLYTFSASGRDPRGDVISVAYFALVDSSSIALHPGDAARGARWVPVVEARDLPFDHDHILEVAVTRLRGKVRYQPIGFELLPEQFTISDLRTIYEAILGRPLDKANFRRSLHRTGLLIEVGQRPTSRRPAPVFQFDAERYQALAAAGFNFEI